MNSQPERSGRPIFVVGSVNMDIVIPADRLPSAGETFRGGDISFFAGGKGANQACAASRFGGSVRFIGKVGRDPFGASLRQSLGSFDVDHQGLSEDGRPTGMAIITVLPNGENSILLAPGANDAISREAALEHLHAMDAASTLLLQLEVPLETVTAVALAARDRGATVILDPAPVCPLPPELPRALSILTPNQTEAAQLLGRPEWHIQSVDDARHAARDLAHLGSGAVIIKLGSLGCFVRGKDREEHLPGYAVDAVDTTGAGDVFNGALAAALAEGMNLAEAADFANAAAAISVTRPGAQASIPTRQEVEAMRAEAPVRGVR